MYSGATAGDDYQSKTGTLTFAPNETSKSFNVTIINDDEPELAESFLVVIENATLIGQTLVGVGPDGELT